MILALPLAVSFRSAARRKKKTESPPAEDSGKKKDKTGKAVSPSPGGAYGID
jgi:hypothetical protein